MDISTLHAYAQNFSRFFHGLDGVSIGSDANEFSLHALTAFSVALQILVLWMIWAKSTKEMDGYRFYLAGITVRKIRNQRS